MKSIFTLFTLLLGVVVATANPIAIPPTTMVGENVLVGVTQEGVVVSGRYQFAITPDEGRFWPNGHSPLWIDLPVPVPEQAEKPEKIHEIVHPVVTIKGAKYSPEDEITFYQAPQYLNNSRLAVFHFFITRDCGSEELVVAIQYDQPVISSASRDMIYYVPMVPTFEMYQKRMALRQDSFLITFESVGAISLSLRTPVSHLKQDTPHLISVSPRNLEVIGVERVPDKPAGSTTSAGTSAAGQPRMPASAASHL